MFVIEIVDVVVDFFIVWVIGESVVIVVYEMLEGVVVESVVVEKNDIYGKYEIVDVDIEFFVIGVCCKDEVLNGVLCKDFDKGDCYVKKVVVDVLKDEWKGVFI